MRAARADLRLPFLAAPEIAPTGYPLPLSRQWWRFVRAQRLVVQRRVRAGCGAPLERWGTQASWPRAPARIKDW